MGVLIYLTKHSSVIAPQASRGQLPWWWVTSRTYCYLLIDKRTHVCGVRCVWNAEMTLVLTVTGARTAFIALIIGNN